MLGLLSSESYATAVRGTWWVHRLSRIGKTLTDSISYGLSAAIGVHPERETRPSLSY